MAGKAEIKLVVGGISGAAVGITFTEFLSEFSAKAAKLTGWKKFGLKALIKGAIAALFYYISTRIAGVMSFFFEVSSYATAGSIVADLAEAVYPGGIKGIAEASAVLAGIKAVETEIKTEVEKMEAKAEEKAPPAPEVFEEVVV